MFNEKSAREKKRIDRINDPKVGKFWEKWFSNPDIAVVWIKPDKQRTVTINAGKTIEWFNKTYPGKVEPLILTKKVYEPGLPRNKVGKIIAVTGVTGRDGIVRPKPIGTFYELFESESFRLWVRPIDYGVKHDINQFNRRKNKKVYRKNKRNRHGPYKS